MNKKLAPLRAKNDVTHAILLKLHERMNKKVAVTSYGRNKNHDDEIKKNQEKANNSPSYRCAAIKNFLKIHLMLGTFYSNHSRQIVKISEQKT